MYGRSALRSLQHPPQVSLDCHPKPLPLALTSRNRALDPQSHLVEVISPTTEMTGTLMTERKFCSLDEGMMNSIYANEGWLPSVSFAFLLYHLQLFLNDRLSALMITSVSILLLSCPMHDHLSPSPLQAASIPPTACVYLNLSPHDTCSNLLILPAAVELRN